LANGNAKEHNNMKIVFFTNKCSHGAELLRQMKNNNILIEAIFIENPKPQGYIKKVKKTLKRLGLIETIKIMLKSLIKMLAPGAKDEWLTNNFYYSYSDKVHIVENFNGKECEQFLKEIKPDLIVLGGSRILRKNIISIPEIGILNSHPGLLPKYRGIDVLQWAIYNGDDIGISVHFVDEGVDTGKIVMRKVINLEENDTLDSLSKKAEIAARNTSTQRRGKTIL